MSELFDVVELLVTLPEFNWHLGVMGFSDEEQIAFAIEQDRVVFTQDTDCIALLHQCILDYRGVLS